ncbi:MAG: FAD-dependent oxidoreductase, partial [Gammaproteobacteria bacterium]|nr:FAD-dependent oxidoreductase [Gammaproteobacteria bacterium]
MREDYNNKKYDLAIIGGGSHGCALAMEASRMGYSVVLLEKEDFSSGTSANSLKVIHGGIRYLQTLSIKRLLYSSRERSRLLKDFPHLVEPLRCFMPTQRKLTKSKSIVGFAFKIYDFLTANRNRGLCPSREIENTTIYSRNRFFSLFSNLKDCDYTGGVSWFDAQVYNTERLVLSYALSAKELGAEILNHCAVETLDKENNRITEIHIADKILKRKTTVKADVVIDTTGPWAYFDKPRSALKFAKAVNFIIDKKLVEHAIGLTIPKTETRDTRLLFYTPWRDRTLVGTWYFPYSAEADQLAEPNAQEVDEILADINNQFPQAEIGRQHISLIHKGLLPAENESMTNAEPSLIAESYLLDGEKTGAANLLAMQGTKFTTARVSAERCLEHCLKNGLLQHRDKLEENLPFYGCEFTQYDDFLRQSEVEYAGLWDAPTRHRLLRNYGTNINKISRIAYEDGGLAEMVPGTNDVPKAEIKYLVDSELVYSLSDLLFRRCDVGSVGLPNGETIAYGADVLAQR